MRPQTVTTHGRLQDVNEELARRAADYRAAARALAEATGGTAATVTRPPADAPISAQLRAMRESTQRALRILPGVREGLDTLEARMRPAAAPEALAA